MQGKVFVVGTPIGNLGDITLRALETLKSVDMIACEDTRHSAILLQHYDIHKPTISYHKFNESQASEKIISLINEGKNIAVISDAGMPGISDPGASIINFCQKYNYQYEIIPGVTAVTTAYVGSNLGNGQFCFIGFLPPKKVDKDNIIEKFLGLDMTLIFYSAMHEVNEDLEYLYGALGDKKVVIANELTKKFEKYLMGNLSTLRVIEPKGEYVILVQNELQHNSLCDLSIREHLNYYLKTGEKRMDAIKLVARDRNVKKNEIYNLLNKE